MPGSCNMLGACTRYSQRPKPQPRSSAQTMASAMAHHSPATNAVTAGVKYRPKAPPIVHWPRLRSWPQLCVGAPAIETSDTEISGPSIHGSGVCSTRHSCAASQASSKVAATWARNRGEGKEGICTLRMHGENTGIAARRDNAAGRSIAAKPGGQSHSDKAMPRLSTDWTG